ncbi:MAG: chromosome segregation protein SMC, partial [Gammaproteobacteria bacterium]|nr:chromosome segregation protein SMC [Gammaproteobacteria bacterium]
AEALNKAQAEGYEVGGTLARIEQQIAHQREMAQRLQRARDEAQGALAELGEHISGDEARLGVLRSTIADAEPQLAQLQGDDQARQDALGDAEAKLADWQQRWDGHSREQAEAVRAGDVERTRVDYLDRQALDAEARREQLASERSGLDLTALAAAFADSQSQHDSQKTALDALGSEVEIRKHAVIELQDQQRAAQTELAEVRKQTQDARGRLSSLATLQQAALGQEQGAAVEWLRQRGLDSAARVGEKISADAGWENAVESALGQLIEGVLVEAPEALVEALGDLGEGRLTLVSPEPGHAIYPSTSLAAKVQGPAAIRRLLSNLHAAETLAEARALLPRLGAGESVITRQGERLGDGWVRVLRSGAAKQGALLREREIQSLRAQIQTLQHRETELERGLAAWRDRLLVADQQREDAQRGLYLAHRGVAELAGQLQSQHGRLQSARGRIEQIEAEVAQLAVTADNSREQAREARARLEAAVTRMAELENTRQMLEAERRTLADAREAARTAARESRDAAHALALTLESERAQIVALSQALERMGGQRGQLDSRLGELAAQLSAGDTPVQALESQRQVALEERVRSEKALAAARTALD